jgi:SOS response regulatory protein OraA/RecX
VPTVTALRDVRRGRIAVELDGAPWRTLPVDVVARAGLIEGRILDRAALRLLRRELRRAEAIALASKALSRRDLTKQGLRQRLERAAVAPATAGESLEVLSRAGLVDDARFAAARAQSLAEQGYGDAAIRHDLARKGVEGSLAEAALDELEPELERARDLVRRRGPGPKTARFLASKGFGEDAIEAASVAHFDSTVSPDSEAFLDQDCA